MKHKTITEAAVRHIAHMSGPNSTFHTALDFAETFRQAGLSPVYYTDEDDKMLFVTTEEKINGETTYH